MADLNEPLWSRNLKFRKLILSEEWYRARLTAARELNDENAQRALRDWWASIEAVLLELREMARDGLSPDTLPVTLLSDLADQIGYLSRGIIPETIKDVANPGTPPAGPREERHISYAVAYLRLTRESVILDPEPSATVGRAYNVHRTTAQSWRKRPLSLEAERLLTDPDALKQAMIAAGRQYNLMRRRRKRTPSKRPAD